MTSIENTGTETLKAIAEAGKFNKWMYQTIKPFAKGNLLEIGSGIGNISQFFLKDNYTITLSDTEENYIKYLKDNFNSYSNLRTILSINIEEPEFQLKFSFQKDNFDTVFLLNVLEHIEKDELALKNISYLLKPGGKIIILTPAYSFLYSSLDRSLGHYRRYTKNKLKKCLEHAGYRIIKGLYFNSLGIAAWLYGKLFRLYKIAPGEMKFYDKLVPIAKLTDKLFLQRIGLSVVMIAQKK